MTHPRTPDGDATRDRARPGAVWLARIAGFLGPCVVLGTWIALREVPPERRGLAIAVVVGVATIAVALVVCVLAIRRTRRASAPPGAASPWTLGIPYTVWIGDAAVGPAWSLGITADAIEWTPLQTGAPWSPNRPGRIELAEVSRVVPRASFVEIASARDGRPAVLRVRTASYADRERLLRELAVRAPDAMERGIEEIQRLREPAGAPSTPFLTATAAGGSAPAAPTANARDAAIGAGLDELGSALSAPPAREQRAPPRSGLGCGLFVTESKDGPDAGS